MAEDLDYQQAQLAYSIIERLIEHTRVDTAHPFFASRSLEFRDRPSFVSILRRPEIHLQDLIREHGKWVEPAEPVNAGVEAASL